MRFKSVLIACVAVSAALLAGIGLGVDSAAAGKKKAVVQFAFGPGQALESSPAAFVASMQNSGEVTASISPGILFEVAYGTGTGPADLVDGSSATVFDVVSPDDGSVTVSATADGFDVSATASFDLAPGEGVVVVARTTAGATGASTVTIRNRLSRKVAKGSKTFVAVVAKTPSPTPGGGGSGPGEPAADFFFGDGADGAVTASNGQRLDGSKSYTDLTIPVGATVTVASGTTLRCTGDFDNQGTILVEPGAGTELFIGDVDGGVRGEHRWGRVAIDVGDARAAPDVLLDALLLTSEPGFDLYDSTLYSYPQLFPDENINYGGINRLSVQDTSDAALSAPLAPRGGLGLGDLAQSLPLSHFRRGGGAGGASPFTTSGGGGGVLRVLARDSVSNSGTIAGDGGPPTGNRSARLIDASGNVGSHQDTRLTELGILEFNGAGSGGGGGGVVILGSAGEVRNSGLVRAAGALGGPNDLFGVPGGGGAGGLVVFCAPSVLNSGTAEAPGGAAGTTQIIRMQSNSDSSTGQLLAAPTTHGAGGGGCIGDGGPGALTLQIGNSSETSERTSLPAGDGTPGAVIVRETDPRAIWD